MCFVLLKKDLLYVGALIVEAKCLILEDDNCVRGESFDGVSEGEWGFVEDSYGRLDSVGLIDLTHAPPNKEEAEIGVESKEGTTGKCRVSVCSGGRGSRRIFV